MRDVTRGDAKNGKSSIICFCCFSYLYEHTAWQQLHHADVTLRRALHDAACVNEG